MTLRTLTIASVLAAAILGAAIGLGLFTFVYARGASYLGNDPASCANCHVMNEHYAAWRKSSHHAVAVCNDCHAPSGGLSKYWVQRVGGLVSRIAAPDCSEHTRIANRST